MEKKNEKDQENEDDAKDFEDEDGDFIIEDDGQ